MTRAAAAPTRLGDEGAVPEVARLDLLAAVDEPAVAAEAKAPELAVAVVKEVVGRLAVELPGRGLAVARRAKSCLVAPDAGDRVLCALDGPRVFVLAVLEGGAGAPTRLEADGDVVVAASGSLAVAAGAELALSGAAIRARARTLSAAIDETRLFGKQVDVDVRKIAVQADKLETRADRVLQRAKQAFRFVSELDQVRAGVVDVRAEGLASVRGETTIVAARVLAKLDGEQVKIG